MPEGAVPLAPLVEDVLNAAHTVAAVGLEMDSRLDADLRTALVHLVDAVYAHEESLELQRELELEGVRAGQVFDVPPPTSYAAHVEGILTSAATVAVRAASPTATVLPRYALAPVCTLTEAITAYHAHPTLARRWIEAGNRPALTTTSSFHDPVPPTTGGSSPPPRRPDATNTCENELDLPSPTHDSVARAGTDLTASNPPMVSPVPAHTTITARPAVRLRLR